MPEEVQIDGNLFLDNLDLKQLKNGVIGHLLTVQLIQYQYSGPGNPMHVVREIHHLDRGDGLSRTKKEAKFSSGKLKGFYHKHYFNAHHIPMNMLLHNVDGKITNSLVPSKGYERIYRKIMESKSSDENKALMLTNFLTSDAFQQRNRSKKLTGDWIIFKNHKSKNYYLCIASHQENTDELYDTLIEWYSPVWPFLF